MKYRRSFHRSGDYPLKITERDIQIMKMISRYRYARVCHVTALFGMSEKKARKRLSAMYHDSYLSRPITSGEAIGINRPGGGRDPFNYGLWKKGAEKLTEHFEEPYTYPENQNSDNVLHQILLADFMTMMELACRESEYYELVHMPEAKWKVEVDHVERPYKTELKPDYFFGIRDKRTGKTMWFFVEADRGTENQKKKIAWKYQNYFATDQQKLLREVYGINNFRVLFVVSATKRDRGGQVVRLNNMIEKAKLPQCGEARKKIFLFGQIDELEACGNPLIYPWRNAKNDEAVILGCG